MRNEYTAYIKNSIKKENFYIDIVSTVLALSIIVLSAVAFFKEDKSLFKAIFTVAFIVAGINAFKGFRSNTPTRMIYAAFSGLLIIVCIYSYIVL